MPRPARGRGRLAVAPSGVGLAVGLCGSSNLDGKRPRDAFTPGAAPGATLGAQPTGPMAASEEEVVRITRPPTYEERKGRCRRYGPAHKRPDRKAGGPAAGALAGVGRTATRSTSKNAREPSGVTPIAESSMG
jgi:hypothetical protein